MLDHRHFPFGTPNSTPVGRDRPPLVSTAFDRSKNALRVIEFSFLPISTIKTISLSDSVTASRRQQRVDRSEQQRTTSHLKFPFCRFY
jgi:hypothetical protein